MKKQKQNLKRFLVWLMVVCMLITQGSVSALAAEIGKDAGQPAVSTENTTGTGVTRIEWLQSLTTTFGMSVEENNYPDNYFADITSDSEYYYDVMLATEFGLIDVEAGDSVYPDAPATREFVAHTFNACMGYVLEDATYTYVESAEVTYPDDIQIAINQEWFTVDEQNQFLPEQQVSVTEKEALIALAKAELEDRVIDGSHADNYVLLDDVIEIPETVEFALVDENVYELTGLTTEIAVGDKIALISGDLPIVRKITAITEGDSVVTITTESVEIEDAFESIDVQGNMDGDLTQVQAYSEDVELSYIVGGTAEAEYEDGTEYECADGLDEEDISAVKLVQTFEIPENVRAEFDLGEGVKAQITCFISSPGADYKINLSNPYINFHCDVTFSCNVSMDVLKQIGVPGSITLAKVPIAGIGYIKATLELSLGGSITLSLVECVNMGIKWSQSTGFQLTKSFTKKAFTIQAQVKASAGVKLAAGFDIAVLKGEIYGQVGATATASSITYDTGIPTNCTHMQAWLYAKIGASIKLDVIFYKDDWSTVMDIYGASNSPVRVAFHYEDGAPVSVCTRDVNEDDGSGSSQYKYYTPADSRYGYSGGSGGIDSEGEEYTIFTYEKVNAKSIRITSYNGNVSALSIPAELDGYKVVEIGANVFKNHAELNLVIIPEGVTVIGSSAFYGCTNLTYVNLPEGVETVGDGTFYNCKNLNGITLPEGVETIGGSAFYNCSNLENVVFPDSLTTIGDRAFYNCTSIKKVVLPEKLESLGLRAFENCKAIEEINIPKDVTVPKYNYYASDGPFVGCVNIEVINMPEGLEHIPEGFFDGCTWLVEFEIPNTVTNIGSCAFYDCSSLENVVFPDGLTIIDGSAFYNCNSLENVVFPDSLTAIGDRAFYNCASIKKVVLPEKLESLGLNAFENCKAIEEINIPKDVTIPKYNYYASDGPFVGCVSIEEINMPEGIERIPGGFFDGCTWLVEFEVPSTVKTIESEAFQYCTELMNITVSEGLETIGSEAFYGCSSLENVVFPDSLTVIGDRAFCDCASIERVALPEELETLGLSAFENCKAIEEINIPKDVTIPKYNYYASDGPFVGCVSIEEINMPEGIERIPGGFFDGCTWLVEFEVPSTVKTIESEAFQYCTELTSITVSEGLETIGSEAFYACESIAKLVIGDNVTIIDASTFYGCELLEEVTLGKNIKTINKNAFANCESLTKISIPRKTTSIANNAFTNSTNVVIYTPTDSYAQQYAEQYGLDYVNVDVSATSISISQTTATVEKRGTLQLSATVEPVDCTDAIVWSSSDETIATVSQDGLVTAKSKAGTVVITAQAGELTATCTITVPQKVTQITLSHRSATINKNETLQLEVTVSPSDAVNKAVSFSSSNPDVVMVDQNGLVKAIGAGTATITVTAKDGSGVSATCQLTVKEVLVTSIKLDKTSAELLVGDMLDLVATVSPDNATNKTVKWTSSNTTIATVNENGKVTALAEGTVTIKATARDDSGVNASCVVNITEPISDGLHQDEHGTWYYYLDGEIATHYTGLVQYYDAWFYVENGVLNWNYTGLTNYNGVWFYVQGGQLNWGYTGLVEHYGAWFYVQGGVLNWDYTGLVQHYDAWFYVQGGQLNWGYTGLVNYNGIWFYVQNGQLNWGYTGLVQHYDAWFYVEGGQLNWNYTGLVMYNDVWFYVENGQLNWAYTGLTCYNGVWFYVEGGMLNWGYTGLAQHYDAWFYVEGGILNWNFTGLALYNNIWFYVENGQLNWGFTGNVYFNGTWWYVENGIMVRAA